MFWYMLAGIAELVSPSVGIAAIRGINWIPDNDNVVLKFIDLMVGEDFSHVCAIGHQPSLIFESYSYPVKRKTISELYDIRVSVSTSFDDMTFKISNLMASDSGSYVCKWVNMTDDSVVKLAVHDPTKFIWIFSERGMKPTRYMELSGSRAILVWADWMTCDGCAGRGERRRLGFCYIKSKNALLQCQDYRKMRFHVRQMAKHKKNEILVETCYEECEDDENVLEPVSSLTVPVENGDSLELVCPGDITTRTSVRWERQYTTMLRLDYSFGYGPARPYFITKSNNININNIDFGINKRILITCVVWRQQRYDFVLALLPRRNPVAETAEHLRVMAISCSIQFAIFLVILVILDAAKAFAENVSLNRTL